MVCFLFAQSNTVCKRFAYGLLFVCTCQTRFVCSLLMVFSVYSKLALPPNSKVDSSTHLLIRCGRVVPERAPWQRQRRRPAVTVGASQPPAGAAARQGYRGTCSLSGAVAKRDQFFLPAIFPLLPAEGRFLRNVGHFCLKIPLGGDKLD